VAEKAVVEIESINVDPDLHRRVLHTKQKWATVTGGPSPFPEGERGCNEKYTRVCGFERDYSLTELLAAVSSVADSSAVRIRS